MSSDSGVAVSSGSGVGVSSAGTGVGLAGSGVSVGGAGVSVGGHAVSVGGIAVGRGRSGVVMGSKTATAVGSTVGVELAQALTPRAVTAMTSSQTAVLKIRAYLWLLPEQDQGKGRGRRTCAPPPDLKLPKKP